MGIRRASRRRSSAAHGIIGGRFTPSMATARRPPARPRSAGPCGRSRGPRGSARRGWSASSRYAPSIRRMSARESVGALPGAAARIDAQLDRAAAQAKQQVEALADRAATGPCRRGRRARADRGARRDQGPRRVAHVDEIAPGLEVAGDQGQRIGAGGQQLGGELAEGLRGGEAGPDRVEHAGDASPPAAAARPGRRPWPATCSGRRRRPGCTDRPRRRAGRPEAPARARRPSPPGSRGPAGSSPAAALSRRIVAQKLPR